MSIGTPVDSKQPDQPGQSPPETAQSQAGSFWKRTDKWRPAQAGTASGCFAVESVGSGTLGLFKPKDVAPEKISADLARAVGVKVPEVHLGKIEGVPGAGAISMAHGKESLDLQHLQQQKPETYASAKMTKALKDASGLLAFHAWVGTGDLKDAHLVVKEDEAQNFVIGAVDFADALRAGGDAQPPPGPPSLISNVDKQVIAATVDRIERCSDSQIESIVNTVPDDALPRAEKDRVAAYLKTRRGQVRNAMHQRGWI
jgi:hypothetical protein